MKKILLFILSFAPFVCYGQIDINKAFEALKKAKTETSIVETSLFPELSIMRQQYRLSRDGKNYGKNNKPYYGETFSLGIKISNGLIVSNQVVEPWKNDEDYKRLNSSNQYKPELFGSFQRSLNNADYQEVDLEFGTDYIHSIDTKNNIFVHEEKKGDFGLSIDNTPGEKNGYMVWVCTNTNLQDSTMSVNVKTSPMRLVASEDSVYISLDVVESDKILGGLYVVPKYEQGGRILLQIVGIATVSGEENKWELAVLTKGVAEEKTSPNPTEVNNDNSAEPTPIETPKSDKKGKKKKK